MKGGKRPGAGGKKPPLPDSEKMKQKQIRFRLAQIERIQAAADREGLTFSEFVRRYAMIAANRQLDDDAL